MPDVGIRELKAKASEIVRAVREERTRYLVTYHGRPVAQIVPLDKIEIDEGPDEHKVSAWDELIRLGEKIGRDWQSEKSSIEILSEIRR